MLYRPLYMLLIINLVAFGVQAQTASVIIPSNVSTGSLEKNVLFYADTRYHVTIQGPSINDKSRLFDGSFLPATTTSGPTMDDPTVITIEGLPPIHVQNGAWVGWSTRYWRPVKFKIEIYNTWSVDKTNQWITVADVDNYTKPYFMTKLTRVICTKIRYTFYEGVGTGGRIQLSELYLLHPEAAQAYDGLMVKYQPTGNVLIGKTSQTNTSYKLDVNGDIRANKVVVNTTGADYVFDNAYLLPSLDSLYTFINKYHHLPEIPPAEIMKNSGVDLGRLSCLQLQKIEELTLYIIEMNKELHRKEKEIKRLQRIANKINNIEGRLKILEENIKDR